MHRGEGHRHYMHGSEDVAHHEPYYESKDEHDHDKGDHGRHMHGSEDVAHHHRWNYMIETLEATE